MKTRFRHPRGDVEDGVRHVSLEPEEKERAEDKFRTTSIQKVFTAMIVNEIT